MKRARAVFIMALLAFLMLILGATAILWYFPPKEQLREVITSELSSRLGQQITMGGFSMGFYPDIEFSARDVRVIDPPSSQQIGAAEKIRFDLNTGELLQRRCVIENIMVASPRVTISRSAGGQWNIEPILTNVRSGTTPETREQSVSWLKFGKVQIRNGSVKIHDESVGQTLNLADLRATVNLRKKTLTIDAASVEMPSLTAKFSGTVSELFTSNPALDLKAAVQVRKEGPLSDIAPINLPAGSKIADMAVNASGSTTALAVTTSFSIDPLATAGLPARGTITGTLQVEQGSCTINTLKLNCGKNTISLSGSLNDLWLPGRAARLKGTSTISLDETVPLVGNSTLSDLDLKGMAEATINLNASSEQAVLSATVDLTEAGFYLPNLIRKDSGSPASIAVNAQFTPPEELIIHNFELVIGDNRIIATGEVNPRQAPWLQTSLHTTPLSLTIFNQLPALQCAGGVITLSAEAWQTDKTSASLEYRTQALMRQGAIQLNIMKEPFHTVDGSIEAVNDMATVPQASFFLAEMPCQLTAEVTEFSSPRLTGQIYTPALDIDRVVKAFGKSEKTFPQPPPSPDAANPDFSLDMAVTTETICFGKLRTGEASAIWHTSGRLQRFDPILADLFGGRLNGSLYLSCQEDGVGWYGTFTGEDMDIESLCSQFFAGKTIASAKGLLHAEGKLHGSSASRAEDVWQSMQGNLKLSASQGEIRQSPLFNGILLAIKFSPGLLLIPGIRELSFANMLLDVVKTRGRTLDVSHMSFEKAEGTFQITDGIAHTDDLYFESDSADFVFKGTFDLVRQEMDTQIKVIPTGTIDSLVGKIPIVGKQVDRVKRATLSFNLTARGPFGDPKVQLLAVDRLIPDKN